MSFPFFTDVDMPHLAVMFGIPSTFPPYTLRETNFRTPLNMI